MSTPKKYDTAKFISAAQVAGIESYALDEGPARGVRVLSVNTGGGLRYRILVDRGLDIDQAFYNSDSLTFLSHKGVTPPTRGLDRGLDWLKGFPVGLLTSCGPFNTGGPVNDAGEELGLHGPHSNTAATIESVIQPDPRAGRLEMSVTGTVRYGALYGPCVELRRTISSSVGSNSISVQDEFFNAGNTDVPHAWLLHINFGYPLVNGGTMFCWDATEVDPVDSDESRARFKAGTDYKRVPHPVEAHRGSTSFVAYAYPKPIDVDGRTTVGIVNSNLSLGVAVHYSTAEFPRCGNWQHWGPHEYVCALEPMTAGVEGRDKDRANGWMQTLATGGKKSYRYEIEVITEPDDLNRLLGLNTKGK